MLNFNVTDLSIRCEISAQPWSHGYKALSAFVVLATMVTMVTME
jgi:hypothetical protein